MFPKTIKNKAGEILIIREAEPSDALAIIKYVQEIITETNFLTRGEGEFNKSEEEEIEIIRAHSQAPNKIFLVAEMANQIVGILNFEASEKPRMRHVGEFGISVSKKYWQSGIGKSLLESLIDWAKQSRMIRKIDLRVRTDNESAIQLYEKFGFEREGTLKREMMIDDKFYDEYLMGLPID